jgi:hypothetical protein
MIFLFLRDPLRLLITLLIYGVCSVALTLQVARFLLPNASLDTMKSSA